MRCWASFSAVTLTGAAGGAAADVGGAGGVRGPDGAAVFTGGVGVTGRMTGVGVWAAVGVAVWTGGVSVLDWCEVVLLPEQPRSSSAPKAAVRARRNWESMAAPQDE